MQYDLIVIGGGPAGYVGAIRAAQLGKSVVCVERDRVGGTCLNWGCIPTKALLKNAEAYRIVTDRAREFGMTVEGVSVDWSEVIGRSRKVSDRLAGGVGFLFKKNKVDWLKGAGKIVAQGTPDEIRASTDPFVHQFIYAEADGPVPFHYPAPPLAESLLESEVAR